MNSNDKSLDILGIKPVGEAINTVTTGSVEGAGAFLSRICLPAAEEFGLLLRDRVRAWRANNLTRIVRQAEIEVGTRRIHGAHPRIVHEILEKGSWTEDDTIQKMWAGLLASSCTESGQDDGNLVFINILGQLTSAQVRVVNFACENAPKFCSKSGLPYAKEIQLDAAALCELTGVSDIHRLDRELDCLRILELIGPGGFGGAGGGFDTESGVASLCPSSVALHLYVRSQGILEGPVKYWDLKQEPKPSDQAGDDTKQKLGPIG